MGQGSRGLAFENLLNQSNDMYERQKRAIIHKRSTPVKVIKSSGTKVLAGYYEAKSTVDYDGVYKGKAIFFEAKSTHELARFDLKNIHDHQFEHLQKCHENGGLCFVLVEFIKQHRTYLLPFTGLRAYINEAAAGGRKSITLDSFEVDAYEVYPGRVPLDYLATVDKIWFPKKEEWLA